jgi:hypothetical protein
MGYHVTILRTTSSGQSPIVKLEVERAAEAGVTDLVRKTKRNQWLLHGAIFGTFVALGLIIERCSGS